MRQFFFFFISFILFFPIIFAEQIIIESGKSFLLFNPFAQPLSFPFEGAPLDEFKITKSSVFGSLYDKDTVITDLLIKERTKSLLEGKGKVYTTVSAFNPATGKFKTLPITKKTVFKKGLGYHINIKKPITLRRKTALDRMAVDLQIPSGKSVLLFNPLKDAATISFTGEPLSEFVIPKVGSYVFGALSDKDVVLGDILIAENGKPLLEGKNEYYKTIAEFDSSTDAFKPISLTENTVLQAGRGYVLQALKKFTLLPRGAIVGETGCASEEDVGKIQCVVNDHDYIYGLLQGTQEKELRRCTKISFREYTFKAGTPCSAGEACRTDANGKSCCQQTFPPPLSRPRDQGDPEILFGERPAAQACP